MADPARSHLWQRGALHTYRFGLTAGTPAIFEHAPRQDPAPTYYDMHLELEFGVVLKGAMERSFEGFTRELGPGDVWYCGVWEPHGSRVTRRGTESLHFVALPTWLSALRFPEAPTFSPILPFTVPPARRPRPDEAQRARIRGLGRALVAAREAGPEPALRASLGLLQLLLLAQAGWNAPRAAAPLQDYGRLTPAMALAQEAHGPVGEAEAARACGMTRERFATRFTRMMGLSFTQFAMRCRLSGAARQLLGGDDPLKKVAYDWGFTDASHFHRTFLKHYGMTPGAYRSAVGTSA